MVTKGQKPEETTEHTEVPTVQECHQDTKRSNTN